MTSNPLSEFQAAIKYALMTLKKKKKKINKTDIQCFILREHTVVEFSDSSVSTGLYTAKCLIMHVCSTVLTPLTTTTTTTNTPSLLYLIKTVAEELQT